MHKPMLICTLVFLLFALFVGWIAFDLHRSEQFVATWPTVEGTIVSSVVEIAHLNTNDGTGPVRSVGLQPHWVFTVAYTYTVNGTEYKIDTNKKYSNHPITETALFGLKPSKHLLQMGTDYAGGTRVPVHYNPQHPEQGYLFVDSKASLYFSIATALLLLGALICLAFWLKR